MSTIRHVMIRGRVQGVGYRAWVEYAAVQHDLEGWVRNRRDGSVEAVFAGPEEAVTQMIDACRRGPSAAQVDTVDARDAMPDELAMRGRERFAVLSTA
jgi:acylphosphatase